MVLGAAQARWLVDSLDRSRATWKVIAADLPIGLTVPDGADVESVANGLPGAQHRVADRGRALHGGAPLLAGTGVVPGLRPVLALGPTFGPEAVSVNAPPAANTSPLDGFQHFGEVPVTRDGELTVWLRGIKGRSLWSKTLQPDRR
ncbi:alkaline phosphatase D family protein [Saccharothrix sp. S26]|uniref:alkaline phosphatase D family protein n=1 Tax=Saccharothrix sp. S26 TaxID=2907215 RepID=UPI0035ABC38D